MTDKTNAAPSVGVPRVAMQLALDALTCASGHDECESLERCAVEALRAALASGASPEPLLPVSYPKREDVSEIMRARFERLFADEQGRNHSTLRRNEQGAYANLRVAADWTFYQRAWADALEAAAPVASEGVTDEQIRATFLAHGFTVKEGQTDLKPYVFEAARALLALAPPAPSVQTAAQEAVGTLTISRFRGHLENHDFDYFGSLPEGTYSLYATPPAPQTDRQQGSAATPAIGAPSGWPDYIAGLLEAYLKTNPDPANREQGFAGIIRRRMYWLASTQAEPSPPAAQEAAFVFNGETGRDLESLLDGYTHGTAFYTTPPAAQTDRQSEGEVTIVTNEAGECVAVTRTDDEHRILSVIWKRVAPPAAAQDEARDAARYRWLRNAAPFTILEDVMVEDAGRHPQQQLDAAIDAALASRPQESRDAE